MKITTEVKKYKYYFKKPRSEIVKDVFKILLTAGAISLAATSPFFVTNLIKGYKRFKKYPKRKIHSAFSNLKKSGDIEIENRGKQIYVSLSEKGKHKAGIFQIDSLEVARPKKWDEIWRIIIFDIGELKKTHREAFRGKLKQLGFYKMQKSAWVHAFDCAAEIGLLKGFFGLSDEEVRFFEAKDIGNDVKIRNYFDIL